MTVSATVSGNGAGPGAITAPDATKPSATNGGQVSPGQSQEHRSMMQKLADNAKYQEQQRANGSSANSSSDTSQSKQEDRAKYLETHACMTTDGADKANELADDCNKVTSSPHKGCNIQQNTCDEIRKNTQKRLLGPGCPRPRFLFHQISLKQNDAKPFSASLATLLESTGECAHTVFAFITESFS